MRPAVNIHAALIAVLVATAALMAGSTRLIEATRALAELCHRLFEACAGHASATSIAAAWAAAALVVSGLVYAAARAAAALVRARIAIARLDVAGRAGSAVLVRDDVAAAFTCGLLRPKVYVTTGLVTLLDRGERRAVYLHEIQHMRSRDPLRNLAACFLKDALYYLPAVGLYMEGAMLGNEAKADDVAAAAGRFDLASAIVRVAAGHSRHAHATAARASIQGAKGPSSIEWRVRRLVDAERPDACHPSTVSLRSLGLSIAFALAIAVSLALPATMPAETSAEACTVKGCTTHVQGAACAEHCATSHYRHH